MNLKDLEWNAGLLASNNSLSPELTEAAKQLRDIVAAIRSSCELDPAMDAAKLPDIIWKVAQPTIVTHVSGGVLTNITADRPVTVISIDYDTDEDGDDATRDPDGDPCVVGQSAADVDSAYVAKVVELVS